MIVVLGELGGEVRVICARGGLFVYGGWRVVLVCVHHRCVYLDNQVSVAPPQ